MPRPAAPGFFPWNPRVAATLALLALATSALAISADLLTIRPRLNNTSLPAASLSPQTAPHTL